jgi:hypothetical protein
VSTDELIIQGFEWLVDYSQHYAEKLPRWPPQECKSHPGTSLEHVGERGIPSSNRPNVWSISPGDNQETLSQ